MRVLITTDAFPPDCGGSGWSTYELSRGLRSRGHEVRIIQPRAGTPPGVRTRDYDGFEVREFGLRATTVPYLRNYLKNERLYPRLARFIRQVIERERVDVVHGQHVLSGPPAIVAARRAGVPSVCTVRDYWPVCYWSDLVYDYAASELCPGCTAAMMRRCVRPRAGRAWPVAWPMIPYMRANLARKRATLARADVVIAVSGAIARDLRARAPELAVTRVETIPNPVDIAAIRAASARQTPPLEGPYAIYAGKLAANKGVTHLLPAIASARLAWPLVVVGDGPERATIEAAARATGRDVRFTGWLPRDEALAWLGGATLLVFPSYGPESLSRVLLEASALGVAVAAMETGGTRDIVQPDVTGLLSRTPGELGRDVARLASDEPLRARLGRAARAHVERTFDAPGVVARVEALYGSVRAARRGDIGG